MRAARQALENAGPFTPKFDANGLVTAVVTDVRDGELLMVAHMNAESLRRTLESREMHFYSRSRQELWCKGETSGDRQFVRRAAYDCDMDAVLVVVEQEGRGACHTGARSCFFRDFGGGADPGRHRVIEDRTCLTHGTNLTTGTDTTRACATYRKPFVDNGFRGSARSRWGGASPRAATSRA